MSKITTPRIKHRLGGLHASVVTWPRWLATLAIAVCLVAAPASPSLAQSAADDLDTIKPFLGRTTALIVRVDPTRLDVSDASLNPASDSSNTIKTMLDRLKAFQAISLPVVQSISGNQIVYSAVDIPEGRNRVPVRIFRKATSEQDTQRVSQLIQDNVGMKVSERGGFLIASPTHTDVDGESAVAPSTLAAMKAAFQTSKNSPITVVFAPPEHVWRTIRELSPELPPHLGGGPSDVLTEGVQWACLAIDPQSLTLRVTIQSKSPEAAAKAAAHLPKMVAALYEVTPEVKKQVPPELLKILVDWLKPKVEGDQVVIQVDGSKSTQANLALLTYLAGQFREQAKRQTNTNQFKHILLAMHNYHDVYRTFPVAKRYRNEDGRPGLSWRVHILPFLEQNELYEQFKLDEPWDSPHNKKLIAKMPNIYQSDRIPLGQKKTKPGHTTYLAPVGEKTVFGGAKESPIRNIIDGTSNTVILLEVKPEAAKPWTAPDDYRFDPKDPLKDVNVDDSGRWLTGFADGSVQLIKKELSAKTILHLFQMNDGNPVQFR